MDKVAMQRPSETLDAAHEPSAVGGFDQHLVGSPAEDVELDLEEEIIKMYDWLFSRLEPHKEQIVMAKHALENLVLQASREKTEEWDERMVAELRVAYRDFAARENEVEERISQTEGQIQLLESALSALRKASWQSKDTRC